MQTIYRAKDGKDFTDKAECEAYEAKPESPEAVRRRKVSEDFKFMVMCAAKGNMGMYNLLRDRSIE